MLVDSDGEIDVEMVREVLEELAHIEYTVLVTHARVT